MLRSRLAAGVAATLALCGGALAQTTGGSRGDTGGPPPPGGTGSGAVGTSSEGGGTTGNQMGGCTGGAEVSAGQKAPYTERIKGEIAKLHAGNQGEIQAGQVAMNNAQSDEVRTFARKMVTDYKRLDTELTDFAHCEGLSLDGTMYQQELQSEKKTVDELQGKTGADFDNAYMSKMVNDHQADAKETYAAWADAEHKNYPQLATVLASANVTVEEHLKMAKQIDASLGKGGGQGATGAPQQGGMGSGSASQGRGSGGSEPSQPPQ
jgi:putative membrane protein